MKIKRVNITGFRAYKDPGDGIFDFQNPNGSTANFVSIYAPNGFGKSSFYDAIEWAITENISRYTKNSIRIRNQQTSSYLNTPDASQRILRNMHIDANAPSYVLVETDKQEFQRYVKSERKNARDFAYDPNIVDDDTKSIIDVFLAQDSIDSFLKEEKPELRYEKFMGKLDQADENRRNKTLALNKECIKNITKLEQDIKKLHDNFQQPEFTFSINEVNTTIEKLYDFEPSYSNIDENFTELEHTKLHTKVAYHLQEYGQKLQNCKQEQHEIQSCIEFVAQQEINQQKASQIQKQVQSLQHNKSILKEISNIDMTLLAREHTIAWLTSDIQKIETIIASIDEFIVIQPQIISIKHEINEFNSSIQNHNLTKLELEKNIELLQKELVKNTELIVNARQDFLQAEIIFNTKEKISNELKTIQQKISELEEEKQTLIPLKEQAIQNLKNYANLEITENSIIDSTVQTLLNIDTDLVISFNQDITEKNILLTELDNLNRNTNEFSTHSQQIEKLLSLAHNIVLKSQLHECPVCQTNYQSYEQLLNTISSNNMLNNMQHSLFLQESKINTSLQSIQTSLDSKITSLQKAKTTRINELTQSIKISSSKAIEIETKLTDYNNMLREQLEELEKHRITTNDLPKDQYIANIQQHIKSIEDQKNSIESDLTENTDMIYKICINLTTEETEKQKRKITLDTLEKSEPYNTLIALQEELKIPSADMNTKTLTEILDRWKTNVDNDQKIVDELNNDKLTLIQQKEGYDSISDIDFAIAKITAEIIVNNIELDSFNKKLKKYFTVEEKINNPKIYLAELSIEKDKYEEELKNNISNLNRLKLQLTEFLPFIKYWKYQKEIQTLTNQLSSLQIVKKQLTSELEFLHTRLKKRVDHFFHTELINQIYQKIDPHPVFKKVEFECIFDNEQKPKIEVYLYENNKTKPIAPNLYFSSAQLNILSLSIFLARALHVEYKGEPVNTILIDDPIQSMDSINILATIDLLRSISINFNKQIILSTHDENFYELLKLKIPREHFGSKFIKFQTFGKPIPD